MTTLLDRQYEFENADGDALLMGYDTHIRVLTTEGLLSQPEQKTTDAEYPEREGSSSGNEDRYTARRILLQVAVEGTPDNIEQRLDEFHTVLKKGRLGAFSMKRPNKVQRFCRGKVRRVEFEGNWDVTTGLAVGGVEIYCPDPRVYSSQVTPFATTVATELGGRVYPRVYNPFRVYGSTVVGGSMVFTNDGNFESPPIIRLYGPSTSPALLHVEQGITMSFDIVLGATDVLEVNLAEHTVILNGTSPQRGTLTEHAWFTLAPGQNEVRYLATLAEGSHVEMDAYSAWSTG